MNLINGSFQGFQFWIKNHSISAENYTKVHDFLNKDSNVVENQGRKSRKFSLEIIVKGNSGEDYHTVRDKFITLLDQKGESELVHPFFGPLMVVVNSYSHDDNGGGIAEFKVEFIEVKKSDKPIYDYKWEYEKIIDHFIKKTIEEVEDKLNIKELLNEYYRKLEQGIVEVLSTVEDIKNTLDYSEYIEKMESLVDLTTNKKHWNNIVNFFSSFLTFENYTKPVILFYKKLLNFNRNYFTGKELREEKIYKKAQNIVHEVLKYASIKKLSELSLGGKLNKSDIDYLIVKIRESKNDLIISGTYDALEKLENYLYFFKTTTERELKTIEVITPTSALVLSHEHKILLEDIMKHYTNINEIMGVVNV